MTPPPIPCPANEGSTVAPPKPVALQALAGLSYADRAPLHGVIGVSLALRDIHAARFPGRPLYWINAGPDLLPSGLDAIATSKLGRASYAGAAILDDQDFLAAQYDLASEILPDAPVELVILRDGVVLFDARDKPRSRAAFAAPFAGLSAKGHRLSLRGMSTFLERLDCPVPTSPSPRDDTPT